jgi:hypothetical protein
LGVGRDESRKRVKIVVEPNTHQTNGDAPSQKKEKEKKW